MNVLLSEGYRKARKNHKCDQCNKTIDKGERYYYQGQIHEGSPITYKCHSDCLECIESYIKISGIKIYQDDDYPILSEIAYEDEGDAIWIKSNFPKVAERLYEKSN